MGLTKPRAAQIFNLDYKQSTRVVTATNITLTGGAPSLVDGVSLSLGDRVLVTGQTTGTQNGLYYVTTLGSGANGTWARTSDGNENGEIEAGMIVMVTEGVIYADTQWKLITDDPIIINTTALTFTQNYMANSISAGTSNVVVNSNANVTISSAGTANVLTISNTGAFVSGVISATGNVTGNYILGNGSQLTGIAASYGNANVATFLAAYGSNTISSTGTITAGNITGSNVLTNGLVSAVGNITGNYVLGNGALLTGVSTTSSNINNGTSNVTVVSSNGNVTVGIGGTSNVAVFSTSGLDVTGRISATGNITGGNVISGGVRAYKWTTQANTAPSNAVPGDAWYDSYASKYYLYVNDGIGNQWVDQSPPTSFYNLSVTGNIQSGNVLTNGLVSATGNITGNYIFGNGSQLTGIVVGSSYSNSNVTSLLSAFGSNTISTTGSITSGNIVAGNLLTSGVVSATGNITGGNIIGGGGSGGNITGANVISGTTFNAIVVSASGNITGGNISANNHTGTTVSVTGNITGNYIFGNGSQLTGIVVGSSYSNSNVTSLLATFGSNVISTTGNITGGNILAIGTVSATGNITGGNIVSSGGTGGNITGANVISANTLIVGNITNSSANGIGNIGSATTYFNTVFAKATSAQYADLAEMYCADSIYTPGTVLEFGGTEEVTATTTSHSTRIAGIVSTNPSYLMNSTLACTNAVEVALVGRVPCCVVGTIAKGDRLVASSTPGVATRLDMTKYEPGCIVGKALEAYDSETVGTIEVAVGRL